MYLSSKEDSNILVMDQDTSVLNDQEVYGYVTLMHASTHHIGFPSLALAGNIRILYPCN